MKYLENAVLTVFSKPNEEDADQVKKSLTGLVPLNLEEEKINLQEQNASGFNEQPIKIFTITLTRQAHTNAFLGQMLNRLTKGQKQYLIDQKESRLDSERNFYIRIEKDAWLSERAIRITDSGNCFHIKLKLAAYPGTREAALALVEKIFKPEDNP